MHICTKAKHSLFAARTRALTLIEPAPMVLPQWFTRYLSQYLAVWAARLATTLGALSAHLGLGSVAGSSVGRSGCRSSYQPADRVTYVYLARHFRATLARHFCERKGKREEGSMRFIWRTTRLGGLIEETLNVEHSSLCNPEQEECASDSSSFVKQPPGRSEEAYVASKPAPLLLPVPLEHISGDR